MDLLVYMVVMIPLSAFYFGVALAGILVPFGIVTSALWVLVTNDPGSIHVDRSPFLGWMFHTAPGLILTTLCGVLLFIVMLHLARGIGRLQQLLASALIIR
ncbi:MAG: sensor domain-containing protein [Proteobacteria bacterium]|nr:sensor domain-containing protein [Pseudomonadota bacterium]